MLHELGVGIEYTNESAIPKGYQFITKADSNKFMEGWVPKFNLSSGLNEKYNIKVNQNLDFFSTIMTGKSAL